MGKMVAILGLLLLPVLGTQPARGESGPFPVERDGAWGYIDAGGKVVIEPQYDYAGVFRGRLAPVAKKGEKIGFIDRRGALVVAPRFDKVRNVNEWLNPLLAEVISNDQNGFVDQAGRVALLPPHLRLDGVFSGGLAKVKLDQGTTPKVLFGFTDMTGTLVIPPRYEEAGDFSGGAAPVKLEGKWGLAGPSGALKVEPQFENMAGFAEGLAAVASRGKWGYLNPQGVLVIKPRFEGAGAFAAGRAPVRDGGKWGFIDKQGKMAIKADFAAAAPFSGGLARVAQDGKEGFINRQGRSVIPCIYEEVTDFYGDIAGVCLEGKWGFVSRGGKMVVSPRFDSLKLVEDKITPGKKGLASRNVIFVVQGDGKLGLVNRKGEIAAAPRFDEIFLAGGMASCLLPSKKWVFVDIETQRRVPGEFFSPEPIPGRHQGDAPEFAEGLARVGLAPPGWGFIDRKGIMLIQAKFGAAGGFAEGLAPVSPNAPPISLLSPETMSGLAGQDLQPLPMPISEQKWGFVDQQGNVVIPPQFETTAGFAEGLAPVQQEGKWGAINNKGEFVIPLQDLGEIAGFREGLAKFASKHGWDFPFGYLDLKGRQVIPPQFSVAGDFSEGLAYASKDHPLQLKKYGYIDRQGQFVIPPGFELAGDFAEGLAAVRSGKSFGYIDKTGKMVISPQFDYAGKFSQGLAPVSREDRYGYIDKTGKIVIPLEFFWACEFSEDRALVQVAAPPAGKRGKFAFIDQSGKIIIPPSEVEEADPEAEADPPLVQTPKFSGGLAPWEVALGKFAYVDPAGKVAFPGRYRSGHNFSEGLAPVKVERKWGYVNRRGQVVWQSAD
jgi:hypothetical protein